ncbi:hypothetical protein [Weissella paramesenteroides]|uniref:hypothetical protein n=1 Tax=Weissella paramesenteroides TaxID=1249 RepID=UPI003890DDA8
MSDVRENKYSLRSAYVFKCDKNNFNIKKINLNDDDLGKLENFIGTINVDRIKELDRESLNTSNKYKISDDAEDSYQRKVMKSLMEMLNYDTNIPILQSFSELFDSNNLLYTSIVYFYKASEGDVSKEDNLEHTRLYVYQLKKSGILKNKLNMFKRVKTDPIENNDMMSIISIDEGFSLPFEEHDSVATFTEKQLSETEKIITINVLNASKFDEIFDTRETQAAYASHVLEKFLNGNLTLSSNNLRIELGNKVNKEDILSEVTADDQLLKAFSSFKGTQRSTIQQTSKEEISDVFNYLRERIKVDADLLFSNEDIPTINNDKIILTKRSVKIFTALLENKIIEKLLNKNIVIPYFE